MAPGTAFGRGSERFIRLCYAISDERLSIAMDRLEAFVERYVEA
jgi:bifunctional pyridoxal-dependent enzyme with beta-cystathionase and maltose regulon repressor activities